MVARDSLGSVVGLVNIEGIMGRREYPPSISEPLDVLSESRILVTGAYGSIGGALLDMLRSNGVSVTATDIAMCDVTSSADVDEIMRIVDPEYVFHLAGAKHAPEGEIDPIQAANINIYGTANILRAAPRGIRVVTASTCKACDPETAYGASKLIAERITLNAGGSVARFYNVPESSGNVFEIWDALPESEPIPVAPCRRYFISLSEALALLVWAAVLPSGRYACNPGASRYMWDVAAALYPGRECRLVDRRRGDRPNEPRHASSERVLATRVPRIRRIESPHDKKTP